MNCIDCAYARQECDKAIDYMIEKGYTIGEAKIIIDNDSVYCDKVGGKTRHFGKCSDYTPYNEPYTYFEYIESPSIKRRKRIKSKLKYKKKLKWQSQHITGYPSPAYACDKNGKYTDNENEIAYIRKVYKSSHADRFKYFKRQAARAVRRNKYSNFNRSIYKKLYNYKRRVY